MGDGLINSHVSPSGKRFLKSMGPSLQLRTRSLADAYSEDVETINPKPYGLGFIFLSSTTERWLYFRQDLWLPGPQP